MQGILDFLNILFVILHVSRNNGFGYDCEVKQRLKKQDVSFPHRKKTIAELCVRYAWTGKSLIQTALGD